MKIKGKPEKPLLKAYDRLIKTNPIKAGYIRNYWNKHFNTRKYSGISSDNWYLTAPCKRI